MPKLGYYERGSANQICDQCGRGFKSSQIMKRWDNALVCRMCWEPRQPQDFVRGVTDQPAFHHARPRAPLPMYYLNVPDPNLDGATLSNDPTKFLLGDLDIRIRYSSSDQAALVSNTIGKASLPTGATVVDGFFLVNAVFGSIQFYYTPTPAQTISSTTTVTTGFSNNTIYWLKVTFQQNSGGSSLTKFYKSTDYDRETEEGTWTQIGATVSGAKVTTVNVNQAPVTIGGGCLAGTMRFYYGEIRNGIDGPIVYYCNPDDVTPSGTIATDNSQWQLVGDATVVQI